MKYKSSVSSVSCGLQYHHLLIKWSPKINLHIVQTYCSSAPKRPEARSAIEVTMGLLNRLTEAGTVLGKNSLQKVSATCKSWWDRYEEFVGINEVREAQGKVTEVNMEIMWKFRNSGLSCLKYKHCEAQKTPRTLRSCVFYHADAMSVLVYAC